MDSGSIHLSGISNGAEFSYFLASRLNDVVATIAPVAGRYETFVTKIVSDNLKQLYL